MTTSLYIHIPFCAAKCNYCSFNSYAGLVELQASYIDSICDELVQSIPAEHTTPLKTIFLGGGTPSILSSTLLQRLLSFCFSQFPLHSDVEISIEANPGTVDKEKLHILKNLGVNRISFGVQSFNNRELERIGRLHSVSEAVQAVTIARDLGFDNISIDLMYGLPGQTANSWQKNLQTALSLDLQHLSLYELTVEKTTPLEKMIQEGKLQLPNEDEIAAMDEVTKQLIHRSKLYQYEISNYAQPGEECRHNITYWRNQEYYGVGAGAVSYRNGNRKRNIADPQKYCNVIEEGGSPVIAQEVLDDEASLRETVIMGLRMNRGVAINEIRHRYGIELENYYGTILQQLVRDKMIEISLDHLCLTDRGRIFANTVMAELV